MKSLLNSKALFLEKMPSLKDIKNRIGSVKSTQKITKAMKMISTARLTKARYNLQNNKEYSHAIQSFANAIISQFKKSDTLDIPKFVENFTRSSTKHNVLTILLSTDKGLCGALNTFLFKEFHNQLSAGSITENLITIGKKAFDFTKNKIPTLNSTPYFASKAENHAQIIDEILAIIKQKNITQLKIIFPEFISTMVQKPKTIIFPQKLVHIIKSNSSNAVNEHYEIEGCKVLLVEKSLEEAIKSLIQEAISQMICSEHSARMIAMDSASNNATAKIKDLTLIYNKTRQANITREILEIVAGSQAM